MKTRLPLYFLLLSALNLALVLAGIAQALWPSWKNYQRGYYRLAAQGESNAAAKESVRRTSLTVQQVVLTGLHRVDRCTTCHLGVDDPTLNKAPQPYAYHPDIQQHPPEKFGCTICHGGQGLATQLPDAHGYVENWNQPLLPKEYITASCGKCHTRGDVPRAPEIAEGRGLYERHGCRGCHKLDGVGISIGPDLGREGDIRADPLWLSRHFRNPQAVSPGSAMPAFNLTPREIRSLIVFMLSMTDEEMASYYTGRSLVLSVAAGRQLFAENNCMTCHGIGGIGGKKGPDLFDVAQRHSSEWLDQLLLNPQFNDPDSTMPGYDMDINERAALVRFMTSATAADAEKILAGRPSNLSPEDSAIEAGKANFVYYGCVGCHGDGGKGGIPNPNTQGGQIPSLIHVASDYMKPEVASIIQKGKIPPVADPKRPAPPLYMPAWKGIMSEEGIQNIIEYLWSLQPKEEATGW